MTIKNWRSVFFMSFCLMVIAVNGMDITSLRNWEIINDNPGTRPGFTFTLMSYNVLAQDLLEQHPFLYSTHDTASLSWPTRWNNLINEISHFQPDILCLQEVQKSHMNNYYSILYSLGFEGVFKKRSGAQCDGVAIYYKTDKIQLIDHYQVDFFQANVSVLNRHNVGIVAKFVPKMHPTREFVVSTTHLLYNPRRDDVRMAQMHLLLTNIEKMSYKEDNEKSYYLPVIITGDLNSSPSSDLYRFITKGKIDFENLSPALLKTDSKKKTLVTSILGITDNSQYSDVVQKRSSQKLIINLDDDSKMKNNNTTAENVQHINKTSVRNFEEESNARNQSMSHKFALKSVYNHGLEGTTFQDEWVTVDYIFYSVKKRRSGEEDKLKLISRYRLPTRDELEGTKIPNKILGSDHLSLIAKFKLEF